MNLHNAPEFIELKKVLQYKCLNKKVFFLSNPGNWGDALIREGALELMKDAGIKHEDIDLFNKNHKSLFLYYSKILLKLFKWKKSILIVCGSGAWCKHWGFLRKKILRFHRFFSEVIILPTTYALPGKIKNTTFFARDKYESLTMIPTAIFCHDTALYLQPHSKMRGKDTGMFFRNDKESIENRKLPENNRDLSQEGNEKSEINKFLEIVDSYRVIKTDRLHVAIAGILMDKEVHLYANNYFKSRAIYDSSLKNMGINFYHKAYKGEK